MTNALTNEESTVKEPIISEEKTQNAPNPELKKIKININGKNYEVEVTKNKTILEVCQDLGIEIPTLCYNKFLENYGACRMCVVQVGEPGKSKLMTSCTTPAEDGLTIQTNSERVKKSRKMTVELLYSRSPEELVLKSLAMQYGVEEPRFKLRDDNCIMCGLCVRMCKKIGREAISFQNRGYDRELGTPYMEPTEECITCGACNFICPTSRFSTEKVKRNSGKELIPNVSTYDEGLKEKGNISIYFTQAVPNTPVIDRDNCVHFQMDGCGICEQSCIANAIDYDQKDEEVELDVGSIILSPGFDEFDAKLKREYGYGSIKNVLTSIEFERILSASGPFEGHVKRLSDLTEPKRIAFIQCVGSRDHHCGNEFCSAVCCMYSIKEAIIAKEHAPGELFCEIFFMDMRAFGKEFDDYYKRAQDEYNIKFTRSRAASIEQGEGDNVIVTYIEGSQVQKKEFDMAVLAVGLEATKSAKELAEKFKIDLNKYNFTITDTFAPLESSRPGIFVSGTFVGPKDIPDTVAQASGAASKAAGVIADQRWTQTISKEYPPERDITGEEPRIGVFVCHCGINIGGVVDVPRVVEYTKTLPNVVYAEHNLFTCSKDTQQHIKEMIGEYKLNRTIVASCTPRTHEPLFRSTTKEGGLNPYLFEMANIRDQCSWIHMNDPEKATKKAKDLVKMAVAKSRSLVPLETLELPVNKNALVIGGGLAGMTAALEFAKQGYFTYLIEKEAVLGGNLNHIRYTLSLSGESLVAEGEESAKKTHFEYPQEKLKEMINAISANDKIKVFTNSNIKDIDGFVGNFKTILDVNGKDETIEHGVIIVATGANEYKPKEYLYGTNENVIRQSELELMLDSGQFDAKSVVMIQCVGCRNDERPYCSRVCCATAVKNALKIKEISPETAVYVINKDLRTYGLREDYYRVAMKKGVIFFKYHDDDPPKVEEVDGKLMVTFRDYNVIDEEDLQIETDILALSAATVPDIESNEKLAQILKVPITKDHFFLEAHMKLRPVDFATEGVFVAGLAHGPKFIDETISQACGSVARASTILSKDHLEAEGIIANVNPNVCDGCGICEPICEYKAIEIIQHPKKKDKKLAKINEVLCRGCGACVGICPSGALEQKGFTNDQVYDMIDSFLESVYVLEN